MPALPLEDCPSVGLPCLRCLEDIPGGLWGTQQVEDKPPVQVCFVARLGGVSKSYDSIAHSKQSLSTLNGYIFINRIQGLLY